MGVAWIQNKKLIMHLRCLAFLLVAFIFCLAGLAKPPSAPPEMWAEYDPDAGEWKEEMVHESVKDGILNRETYVSAWVRGEEIRSTASTRSKMVSKRLPACSTSTDGWERLPSTSPTSMRVGR